MAKLNAHGSHEVARIEGTTAGGHPVVLVLRSDRAVLRKNKAIDSTFKLLGKVKKGTVLDRGVLDRQAARLGYTVNS